MRRDEKLRFRLKSLKCFTCKYVLFCILIAAYLDSLLPIVLDYVFIYATISEKNVHSCSTIKILMVITLISCMLLHVNFDFRIDPQIFETNLCFFYTISVGKQQEKVEIIQFVSFRSDEKQSKQSWRRFTYFNIGSLNRCLP